MELCFSVLVYQNSCWGEGKRFANATLGFFKREKRVENLSLDCDDRDEENVDAADICFSW